LRSVRLPLSARGRRPKQLLIAWEKLNGKLGPRAFQDVHEGGPAHVAGLRPGDILLQVRDRELRAPEPPIFPVGEESQYAVQKPDGKRIVGTLNVPSPRSKNHPVVVPKAVLCSQMPDGIGWLKVTMFPGSVGIDVARMLDAAF